MPGTRPSDTSLAERVLVDTGIPWHTVVNRYTHYNTPNKLTCLAQADRVASGEEWTAW